MKLKKTQIVVKLKNSNCDKTQKLKLWWNSKTQIVINLKISNCEETQKLIGLQNSKLKLWVNSKTKNGTKLKKSNFDKTQKLKLWQNWNCNQNQMWKTQIDKTQIVAKVKFYKTQRLKLWQTQKLILWQKSNINYDKSQCMRRQNLQRVFIKNILNLDNRWNVLWSAISCKIWRMQRSRTPWHF